MQVEIISKNENTGVFRFKFSHNDVVHEQDYNLKMVVPGTDRLLNELGLEFDATMQQRVIDKLTAQIQREIEAGIIKNPI